MWDWYNLTHYLTQYLTLYVRDMGLVLTLGSLLSLEILHSPWAAVTQLNMFMGGNQENSTAILY